MNVTESCNMEIAKMLRAAEALQNILLHKPAAERRQPRTKTCDLCQVILQAFSHDDVQPPTRTPTHTHIYEISHDPLPLIFTHITTHT